MESTAPTTGPRAAQHGIADFRERLHSAHNLKFIPTYKWTDPSTGVITSHIQPLNSGNIDEWISMSLANERGFEPEQFSHQGAPPDYRLREMIEYALNINSHRATAANLDQQYQANLSAYNVAEQTERNRITFMNHDQLIQDLAAKGFNTQSSAISSANDGQLRKMLWDRIGPLNRGGRRRKTRKHKRRHRKTRRARK